MKNSIRSHRQHRKETLRKMYGNPWDSSSKSSSKSISQLSPKKSATKRVSSRMPKKSSIKSRTQTNRVTFREPLERSASKSKSSTSRSHAVWRSVSSVEK